VLFDERRHIGADGPAVHLDAGDGTAGGKGRKVRRPAHDKASPNG
jgi:hypothetical protein